MKNIQVIAFDADDTLWVNESYFQETETKFCGLLSEFLSEEEVSRELLKTEMQNVALYGYGVKSFVLSMMEAALHITGNKADSQLLARILELGKEQLNQPVKLLDGVQDVLENLHGNYKLVMATKGDLLDQERKLKSSSLERYFHHIEIMSDKRDSDYQKLVEHLDCDPKDFLMIGNSVKSDIIPVLEIGGNAAYIPYHVTWSYEKTDIPVDSPNCIQLKTLPEIIHLLS